jgi:hypothetical protein
VLTEDRKQEKKAGAVLTDTPVKVELGAEVQRDSKLMSGFSWPIIFKLETKK